MPHFQSPELAAQPDSFFLQSSSALEQVSPSQTRAEDRLQKIRIKNRRKLYLDRHPSYFSLPDLELADPLLYDRCIRRFQTASEREADGRTKGYSGVLEADLYRSEAKIAALRPPSPPASSSSQPLSHPPHEAPHDLVPFVSYAWGKDGEVLPEEEDEVPKTREEGYERWKFGMTLRFLRGEDEDFEYRDVDESEEDEVERREREEEWFEEESPGWVSDEDKARSGETGVQDY